MKTTQNNFTRMMLLTSTAIIFVILFSLPAIAQTNAKVADEVVALAKAQWAAEIAGKTSTNQLADEYTEFSPGVPTRVDGKAMNTRLFEASSGGSSKLVAAEMANPKVQVYGDVAILSYNFVGMTKDSDGKVEPTLAKSTRVYAKKGGKWMLVHANFAPVN